MSQDCWVLIIRMVGMGVLNEGRLGPGASAMTLISNDLPSGTEVAYWDTVVHKSLWRFLCECLTWLPYLFSPR